jgi:hypothetical protein
MPFFTQRSGSRATLADPRTHRCDVGDIDYAKADEGIIDCRVCGRVWRHARAWVPDPCPQCNIPGGSCFHYGRRNR